MYSLAFIYAKPLVLSIKRHSLTLWWQRGGDKKKCRRDYHFARLPLFLSTVGQHQVEGKNAHQSF
jgi:hypothetical protein